MIDRHILNVSNAEQLADFYRMAFGMKVREASAIPESGLTDIERCLHLSLGGDPGTTTTIELRQFRENANEAARGSYRHEQSDVYWKIGFTHPDLTLATRHLRNAGIDVSEPKQFLDIGFLCHLSDPEGFQIELLQHEFHRPQEHQESSHETRPLDATTTLGQITLRVNEIERSLVFYRDVIGLKLLSVQPVEPHRFTLYFLAATKEAPPHPDLETVENRPWLWQRPYTLLELQHFWDPKPFLRQPEIRLDDTLGKTHDDFTGGVTRALGFAGLVFDHHDLSRVEQRLFEYGFSDAQLLVRSGGLRVVDPQGVPIEIRAS